MNKLYKKYIKLFIILTICIISLTGCYNQHSIDDLAYVVAIGIDVGTSNTLKVSFQIANTNSSGDKNSSNSQASESVISSIECDSIDSGINLVNSYISKQVNLSHCKAIVFSEKLASTDLSKYIYTLVNKIQVRPNCNIIISRCDANYFLKNSKPTLEKLSAKYYEVAPTSTEYTGYSDNITLQDFFSSIEDTFKDPYAILR